MPDYAAFAQRSGSLIVNKLIRVPALSASPDEFAA